MSGLTGRAAAAAERIADRAARLGWAGHDPYDGLWWAWPRLMVGGPRRRQAVVQLHARIPLNVRRLRRSEPPRIAKTLGLFAETHQALAGVAGQAAAKHESACRAALDLALASASLDGVWGYPFDVQTRWGYYPAGTPNVVVTAFVGEALWRAAKALDVHDYELAATGSAAWVSERLYLEDRGYFAYHLHSKTLIHNANLLGARFVWHAMPGARSAVERAVDATLSCQSADGSWRYGEGSAKLDFVDGLHTGYVLDCLADLTEVDPTVEAALGRGFDFYAEHCFRSDGAALLRPGAPAVEDAHSAGTALTTLSRLAGHGLPTAELAERVGERALSSLVRGDRTIFRRYRRWANRQAYLRWCDAHLARGLATHARVASSSGREEQATR
jgi:hypothetical protein